MQPSAGNSGAYVLDKELVFDIDMDDYNSVKGCGCTAKAQSMASILPFVDVCFLICASVCKRCWRFMSIAVEVVDRILRSTTLLCRIIIISVDMQKKMISDFSA